MLQAFDQSYYLQNNPDVLAAVSSGLMPSAEYHYIHHGEGEGRMPSPFFDPSFYLSQNSDVLAAVDAGIFSTGLQHYSMYGADEGRSNGAIDFDETFYLAENPDVAGAVAAGQFDSGYDHFVAYGAAEGRAPAAGVSADTDTLTINPDVATANVFEAPREFNPGGTDQMNTLQDDDVLTGVGNNPTLNFTFVDDSEIGNPPITPTLNGIETVNVSVQGSANKTLDLQDTTGVDAINVSRMNDSNQMNTRNIAESVSTMSVNNSQAPNAPVAFTFLGAALAGSSDETALTLNNANLGSLRVEESVATPSEGYETINLTSTGSTNAAGFLQAEDLQTLNITGDQALTLGGSRPTFNAATGAVEASQFQAGLANVAGSLDTIDATGLGANLTLHLGPEMNAFRDGTSGVPMDVIVTSGIGDDSFVLTQGASIDAGDIVDGGDGANTMTVLGGAAQTITAPATGPNLLGIPTLEVRTGHDSAFPAVVEAADTVTVDVNAFDMLESIFVRNEGQQPVDIGTAATPVLQWRSAAEGMTVNLNNLSETGDADGLTQTIALAHGTTGNSTIANNIINTTQAVDADDNALQVTLVDGVNTDPVFNAQLNLVDVERPTIVDNDTESNTVFLDGNGSFTQDGSTLTVAPGDASDAGNYMNFDSFSAAGFDATLALATVFDPNAPAGTTVNPLNAGYALAADGSTGSNTSAVDNLAAIPGVPSGVSTSRRDNAVDSVFYGSLGTVDDTTLGTVTDYADRLVFENIEAGNYDGDIIARLGDITRDDGVTSMSITTGSGNDTLIFDAVGSASAGFTSGDTINAGAGRDTLVLDGNTATVSGTPRIDHQSSEWDNLSGVDVLRFGDNNGANNNKVGNANWVAINGGGYAARIDNEFVGQTDNGNRLVVINNDGDLRNNGESDLVLDMRGLSQDKAVTFIGANGVAIDANGVALPGVSSNRLVVDDTSANQGMVLNGGDTDIRDPDDAATAGYVAGNNNVLEIRNTANVSIADLSQVRNFGRLDFTNDTSTDQTLNISLDDGVVNRLVDASQAASSTTPETLILNARDNLNPSINNATTSNITAVADLEVDAGALTDQSNMNILGGRGVNNITTGDGDDSVTLLGQFDAADYALAAPVNGIALSDLDNNVALAGPGNWSAQGDIDLGNGTDTLETYGAINLAGVTLNNIEFIVFNSSVSLTDEQLNAVLNAGGVTFTDLRATHTLEIVDTGFTGTLDFSNITLKGSGTLDIETDGIAWDGTVAKEDADSRVEVDGEPQGFVVNDAEFEVAEDAPNGRPVGTMTVADDVEIDSFEITAGNIDVDEDGNDAFRINDNGDIEVHDTKDLTAALDDPEYDPFNLTIRATDEEGNTGAGTATVDVIAGGEENLIMLSDVQPEVTAVEGEQEVFVLNFDSSTGASLSSDAVVTIEGFTVGEDMLRFDDAAEPPLSAADFLDVEAGGALVVPNGFATPPTTVISFQDDDPADELDPAQITLSGINDASLGGETPFYEVV
ncbi:beta strand repeat-containing protein [Halochromatium salexigens]|uniref:Cadherin domain-containing protein n=1 Tax=Halochromatium salexigens TaxID=49447 RepID=A0AAJ0UF13_HALSE|nr:hypothetical protein [Halochromatium salexigens]MBK5929407.1 hypothetical protein [Halochromatium salexigens]